MIFFRARCCRCVFSIAALVSFAVRLLLKNTQHFLLQFAQFQTYFFFLHSRRMSIKFTPTHSSALTFIAHKFAMYPQHRSCMRRDWVRERAGRKRNEFSIFLYSTRVKIIALVALPKSLKLAKKTHAIQMNGICVYSFLSGGVNILTELCKWKKNKHFTDIWTEGISHSNLLAEHFDTVTVVSQLTEQQERRAWLQRIPQVVANIQNLLGKQSDS